MGVKEEGKWEGSVSRMSFTFTFSQTMQLIWLVEYVQLQEPKTQTRVSPTGICWQLQQIRQIIRERKRETGRKRERERERRRECSAVVANNIVGGSKTKTFENFH